MKNNTIKTALIIGCNSDLIHELCKLLIDFQKYQFILVGHAKEATERTALDLKARGAVVLETLLFNAEESLTSQSLNTFFIHNEKSIDLAIVGHGLLLDQKIAIDQQDVAIKMLKVNFTSYVEIGLQFIFLAKKKLLKQIVIISSVAGDRGRGSNFIYGSGFSGKNAFYSGVRALLSELSIPVLIVKPGLMRTKMTAHLNQKGLLWAETNQVANLILKNIINKYNGEMYAPSFWYFIMLIVKNIPEKIFMKLKF